MTVRICAFPGCSSTVNVPRLVCFRHWGDLPPRIRAAISGYLSSHDVDAARIVLDDYLNRFERPVL